MTLNMVGRRYGKLVVVEEAGTFEKPNGKKSRLFKCKCDCGEYKIANGRNLRQGSPKSCGFCKTVTSTSKLHKYGLETYNAWHSMKDRCYNKNNQSYKRYGGRGIKVIKRWVSSLDNFVKDMGLFKEIDIDFRIIKTINMHLCDCKKN